MLLGYFARRTEEDRERFGRAGDPGILLRGLARGQNLRLFLLWLFDFFLLTVVAFTHNKLLVWLVALSVPPRGKSATGKTQTEGNRFAQRTEEATEEGGSVLGGDCALAG
jgi:hypothetical protein